MRFILIILLLVVLAGCAVAPVYSPVTGDDATWLRDVWKNESLEFTLPAEQAPMAWKRGQSFVARFSGNIIYAYTFATRSEPGASDPPFFTPGFNISRIVQPDESATFHVQAYGPYNTQTHLQAKLLARYMRTGQIREKLVGRQVNITQLSWSN